jgi:lipopolysaccharide transport system permease protein
MEHISNSAIITTPTLDGDLVRATAGENGETCKRLALTVIERADGSLLASIADIWVYRELLMNLVWRDIKVRYKQTVLGIAWAVLQPLTMMLVFVLFFRRVAGGGPSDIPYSVFVFSGLIPWTYFATAVSSGGQSILGSQNLVTKVYFPRLVLPLCSVLTALVDLMISSLVLVPMMVYYRVGPGWGLVVLPVALLGLTSAALGIGALLTSLTVRYRDLRFVVPFLVQVWLFATPAVYLQADALPGGARWRTLLALNPAQGLITNLRAAILNLPADFSALVVSMAASLSLLFLGCAFFHRQERYIADIV